MANFVVSIGSDGKILSQGTVSDALAKDQTLSLEVAEEEKNIEKAEDEIDPTEDAAKPTDDSKKDAGKLVVAEEIAVGHVSWSAGKPSRLSLCRRCLVAFFSEIVPPRDEWQLACSLLVICHRVSDRV